MMATIIHIEGFENVVTSNTSQSVMQNRGYVISGTSATINNSDPRRSGKFYWDGIGTTTAHTIEKSLGGVYDRLFLGAAIKKESTLTDEPMLRFRSSASATYNLSIYFSGETLQLRRGTTLLESKNNILLDDGTYHYYVFEIYLHDSDGFLKVWRDGSLVWTSSAYDTVSVTQSGSTSFVLVRHLWDDIYVASTTGGENPPAYDCYIDALFPNADTAQKDFSRSAGSDNYALIDEQGSDDDTTYVYSGTNGHKDLYDIESVNAEATTIYAVMLDIHAKKDDTDVISLTPKIKSGSTEGSGATTELSGTYLSIQTVFTSNPDTSAVFTPSEINSLQIGQEVTV